MDKRPVGIFDSGLGGLTAYTALRELMPDENIIYFGDTARCPYGTRPRDELRRMTLDNLALMEHFGVKAVIAACGTMSANSTDILNASRTKVINVLEPSIKAMSEVKGSAPLAVIATQASIRSGAFTSALGAACPGREIIGVATQDYVRLCEEGHISPEDEQLKSATAGYLAGIKNAGVSAMLLGCTHFGIVSGAISAYLGDGVELLSASECAAKAMKDYLTSSGMTGGEGRALFYTSGDTAEFEEKAANILGFRIKAEKAKAGE